MKARPEDRSRARKLRRDGVTYRQIAAQLGIAVNTAYRWSHDIELSACQRQRNRRGPTGKQDPALVAKRADAWSQRCRARRAVYQDEGRARARADHDPLHLQGCMLYWAEGTKDCNAARFSNSDIAMSALFCRFLRESLHVPTDQIQLRLNVYTNNGLTIAEIEQHWLALLDLPTACLRKHALNKLPTSSSGASRRRLVYGVGSLVVQRTWVVQHIYGAIQSYAGIDRPDWLDTRIGTRHAHN
jgi:hypothetical protein